MNQNTTALGSLCAAAALLNSLAGQANANPLTQEYSLDYLTNVYQEGDIPRDKLATGSESRYTINTHLLMGVVPLTEDSQLTITGLHESMTGASPWYVVPGDEGEPAQVMSNATIDEARNQIDLDLYTYHDRSESTLSLSYSKENDYDSVGFGYSGAWRFNNDLTSINFGLNAGQDNIHPTQDDRFPGRVRSEAQNRLGGFVGVSHIMTKNRLVGLSLGTSNQVGYLSDPYKQVWIDGSVAPDARPDRKSLTSLSLMWREYLPAYNAALHTDLAAYQDNWTTTAASLNLAWHQNLPYNWQLVPSMRVYHQTEAAFYSPYYETTRSDGYYSSDYRLSEFTAFSGKLKAVWNWSNFQVKGSYEYYGTQGEHPGLVSYSLYSFGMGATF